MAKRRTGHGAPLPAWPDLATLVLATAPRVCIEVNHDLIFAVVW